MKTAWILLLAAVLCAGCASKGYIGHRARDAADIVTVAAGKGVGAKVHLLPVYVTAFHGWNRVMANTDIGARFFGPIQADLYYYNISGLGLMSDGWETGFGANFSMDADDWRQVSQIGIALGVGVGVGVGANLLEAVDFVLGFTTLDLLGDDHRDTVDLTVANPRVNPAVSMKPAVEASKTLMDRLRK